MSVINKPDYKIFAQDAKSGEFEAFPDVLRGWGVTIEQTAGKPPMEWFNALGKRTDEWLMYLTQRGIAEWSNTISYPKSAVIQFSNVFYVALKETKEEQPDNSQGSWAPFLGFIGGYTKKEADDALKTHEKSRNHPNATTSLKGFVQLSNATDSNSEVMAATSVAVKTVNDNANSRVSKAGDTVTGAITSTALDNWRIVGGDYGAFLRNDGSNYYLLFTDAKNQLGSWNGLRPFYANLKTGHVVFGHGLTAAGITTSGFIETTGNISIKTDNRSHLSFQNGDGSYRMYIYKDRNGDGVRINNGADNSGDFVFHKSGNFFAPGEIFAGGSKLASDGNLHGATWGGWLSTWLSSKFTERDININTRAPRDWANSAFASRDRDISTRATWDWVNQNFSTATRLGVEHIFGPWWGGRKEIRVPNGYVVTGFITNGNWELNGGDDYIICRPIQFYRSGAWITAGG